MSNGSHPAFPMIENCGGSLELQFRGLTKREYFAGIAMHAEFLSCGQSKEAAEALADAAADAGQSIEQRIAINALGVADALLAELAKGA